MTLLKPAPPVRQGNPEVTLVTSAYDLPVEVRDYSMWRSGLAARSTQAIAADARGLCASGDLVDAASDPTEIEFEPFYPYVVHGCSGYVDENAYRAEAAMALDDKLAFQVGRELWTGSVSGTNPSLQNSATEVSGTADPANVAANLIANLLESIEGGQVFLHVPAIVMPSLSDTGYVKRSGNRVLTVDGHVVVPDPGYPNSPGDYGPQGSTPSDSGEVWMYATGPVEYAQGEAEFSDIGRGTAARQNRFEVFAKRPVIVRFDPTNVLGGLATLYTLGV